MSESEPNKAGTREVILYATTFGLVCVLITLPSVIIGFGAWYLAGRKLGRREHIILFIAGLVGFGLDAKNVTIDYFTWIGALAGFGSRGSWPLPWPAFILLALCWSSLLGILMHDSIRQRLAKKASLNKILRLSAFQEDGLIPDAKEKAKTRIAGPPDGILGLNASDHGIDRAVPQGKRSVAIGLDRHRRPVQISEQEIGMHGLILGSTGSGKTVSIQALMAAMLDLGWAGMLLDLKEDTSTGGLRDFCASYSSAHAIPFQQLALSDPAPALWFNPLLDMGPDEARDTILSLSGGFDDQFWQNVNKKVLGQLVSLFWDVHAIDPITFPYPDMYTIGKVLGSGSLPNSTKKMRAVAISAGIGRVADDYSALGAPSQDEQKSAIGFGAKLTQIYDTQAGRAVLRPSGTQTALDVTVQGLTYIGLDTQGKADMSQLVSSAVLQRMAVWSAQRTTGVAKKDRPYFIIVDEASVVHRPLVKIILSKARSAGIALVLCTQSPTDWNDDQGQDWQDLAQNVNFTIVMAQGSSEAAELCADHIGEHKRTAVQQKVEGGEWIDEGSLKESVEHVVRADELRRLQIGEAILRVNKPDERITWMAVKIRDPEARVSL